VHHISAEKEESHNKIDITTPNSQVKSVEAFIIIKILDYAM
jgi:hypothetical protein